MNEQEIIMTAAKFLTNISTPRTAFGLWLSVGGVVAGAYFMTPL